MLTVISPAKNLDFDRPLPKLTPTQPVLLDQAERLAAQLKTLAPHELSALMRISDKLGQLNYERFQDWHTPFTPDNARAAVFTFAGDVYQGLAVDEFTSHDLKFAQQHLRILSGLYGVLRPLDLMQAYRLEMGTTLATSKGKDLYHFWGEHITAQLNTQLQALGAKTLVNLASVEYFKAVKRANLQANIVEPVFKDWKNGEYKIISFFAKKARGLMSAYIVKNRLTSAEQLKRFDLGGYLYNEAMSTEGKWVFIRKEC